MEDFDIYKILKFIDTSLVAIITFIGAIWLKNRETHIKMQENFIVKKIEVYDKIREIITYFEDMDFPNTTKLDCQILSNTDYGDTYKDINYCKLLSDIKALGERTYDLHLLLTRNIFFIEPDLYKKLLLFREILHRAREVIEKSSKTYNSKLISFLVTEDIRNYCDDIKKDLFAFYNKKNFFKLGERMTIETEEQYRKEILKTISLQDKLVTYIISNEANSWSHEHFTSNRKKKDSKKLKYLDYLDYCIACGKKCWN